MKTKLFEVRDRMTYIPVMATKLVGEDPMEKHHLKWVGFSEKFDPSVMVTRISDAESQYNPYAWDHKNGRTMHEVHKYIRSNFDDLENGAVIDIEYILGETTKQKESKFKPVFEPCAHCGAPMKGDIVVAYHGQLFCGIPCIMDRTNNALTAREICDEAEFISREHIGI